MSITQSEEYITSINSDFFFREFTFRKNDFRDIDSNNLLEFADNVIWLDDYCFLFQIKEKTKKGHFRKWFENKILKIAVKQIKATLHYLQMKQDIEIENEAGHKFSIKEVGKCRNIRKVIIFEAIDEEKGDNFYTSKDAGVIHIFSATDYYWVCRYLVTIPELEEYLDFREKLYKKHGLSILNAPEQYILGHFFETLDVNTIHPEYIGNVEKFNQDLKDFDMGFLIEQFSKKITTDNLPHDYYTIIKEICKLNRTALYQFKRRFDLSLEQSIGENTQVPYRLYVPKTDCAFVFIPITEKVFGKRHKALLNYTHALKYIHKSQKCIGLAINRVGSRNDIEMLWCYTEGSWSYDIVMESALKNNFPFREGKASIIQNRYKKLY